MFIYVCMYVCMYGGFNLKVGWNIVCMCVCMYVYMCVCIYVSQGDFRLMSFTAGRFSTVLILEDAKAQLMPTLHIRMALPYTRMYLTSQISKQSQLVEELFTSTSLSK